MSKGAKRVLVYVVNDIQLKQPSALLRDLVVLQLLTICRKTYQKVKRFLITMINYMRLISGLFAFMLFTAAYGQEMAIEKSNIAYGGDTTDAYVSEKCLLDVYFPTDTKDFPTVVWFHGGGLTGGEKEIPEYLKGGGVGVIGVGYRLSPQAKVADIIEDAADAIKWAFDHVEGYGGSKDKIILSGHSAGGYLALMVGLNKAYLEARDLDANKIMALIPFSAQAVTHFTKRAEDGIEMNQATIDEFAPIFWVRKDAPPVVLITGDRELEIVGRYEENAYLARMLKVVEHPDTKLLELDGYDHGMVYPALPLLLKEIARLTD